MRWRIVKTYRVMIYNHHCDGQKGRVNRPLAYLTYQGQGGCSHALEAENGNTAKEAAIAKHLLICDQSDRLCLRCKEMAGVPPRSCLVPSDGSAVGHA